MKGLITKERRNIDPAAAPFAKDLKDVEGLREGASLVEVVRLLGPFTHPNAYKNNIFWPKKTLV